MSQSELRFEIKKGRQPSVENQTVEIAAETYGSHRLATFPCEHCGSEMDSLSSIYSNAGKAYVLSCPCGNSRRYTVSYGRRAKCS